MRQFACGLAGGLLALGCVYATAQTARPAWIDAPSHGPQVGVVGTAPKVPGANDQMQRRVAVTRARQELGRMVRVRVESTLTTQVESGPGGVAQSSDRQTRLASNVALQLDKASVAAEWRDPTSGELFVWMVMSDFGQLEAGQPEPVATTR